MRSAQYAQRFCRTLTMVAARDPGFEKRVRGSFDRQNFMSLIGARIELVEPGRCVIHVPFRADLCQQHGFIHAGVTTAIADTAAGYAAYSLFPVTSSILTIEFKINLLAPAEGDELVARARVIRSGRTITVVQSDVFGVRAASEKHVAAMQATMMCLHDTPDVASSAK